MEQGQIDNFMPGSKKGGGSGALSIVIIILIILIGGVYFWYQESLKKEQAQAQMEAAQKAAMTPQGQTAEDKALQAELNASGNADVTNDMQGVDDGFK